MLNHEGWSLMVFLAVFIALLLLALPHMGAEKAMTARLTARCGRMGTAMSTALRMCGVLLLAAVPGAVHRGGWMRLGLAVFPAAGLAVLLCVLVPRIKRASAQALTLCQAVAEDPWGRAGFAAAAALAALVSAAGAVSMLARIFAYVFSLHYQIALGAAAALVLVLTLLCGAESRRRMDGLQFALAAVLLIGTPAAAVLAAGSVPLAQGVVQAVQGAEAAGNSWLTLVTDVLAGVCAMGMLLPAQRLFSETNEKALIRGGRMAALVAAVLLLLAALCGMAGRAAGIKLETIPAAETVLTQIAERAVLPEAVSAVLTAALVTTLLLFAQSALRFVGVCIAWDVFQPFIRQNVDRPLVYIMDGTSLAACLLTFPMALNANTPLTWYAQTALLCGTVPGSTLMLRAFSVKAQPLGQRIGLAAGAAAVLITLLVPIPETYKLLGAVPAVLATVLPQIWLCKRASEAETAEMTKPTEIAETPEENEEIPAKEEA